MRLEQLKYVVTVAECQSINKASSSLFLTPQALNRSIAAVEKEMGVLIFERFTTGVQLTKEGKQVVALAKRMLADYESVMASLHRQTAESAAVQSIRLYVGFVYADSYFNNLVINFNDSHSDIQVIMDEYNHHSVSRIFEHLHNSKDPNWMFFTNVAANETSRPQFIQQLLQETVEVPTVLNGSCVACVSKDNLLAQQKEASLKVLAQYPLVRFITGSEKDSDNTEAYFNSYATNPSVHLAGGLFSWINAIAENVGVGLIIDVACRHSAKTRDLFDKIKTLTIKEDTSFQSCFILPPNYSNAVSQFVEFACNELRRIV